MVNVASQLTDLSAMATGQNPGAAYRSASQNRAYTDLSALQDIRALGKDDQDAALKAVAKQFESMFIGMMLSSMRQASDVMAEGSLLNSPEQKFFQSMFDDQMSLSMTQGQGTGLSDVIYRQMLQEYKPSSQPMAERDSNARLAPLPKRQAHLLPRLEKYPPDQLLADQPTRDNTGVTTNTSAQVSMVSTATRLENQLFDSSDTISHHTNVSSIPANNLPKTSTLDQQVNAEKGQWVASAQQFIAAIYPAVKSAAQQLGVDIKALLSQAALETGWGKHIIQQDQQSSFNLFGIKAGRHWQGQTMTVMTHEYHDGKRIAQKDSFRAYHSLEQGLQDYCNFLQQSTRYQSVLAQQPDADQYGFLLQQAGYATDPKYGEKIAQIAAGKTLNNALKEIHSGLDINTEQPPLKTTPIRLNQSTDSVTQSSVNQLQQSNELKVGGVNHG